MKFKTGLALAIILFITAIGFALGCGQSSASSQKETTAVNAEPVKMEIAADPSGDEVFNGVKIKRTDAEWKKLLTPAQYNILREEGTDYPFKSQYHDNHEDGDYYCAQIGYDPKC